MFVSDIHPPYNAHVFDNRIILLRALRTSNRHYIQNNDLFNLNTDGKTRRKSETLDFSKCYLKTIINSRTSQISNKHSSKLIIKLIISTPKRK